MSGQILLIIALALVAAILGAGLITLFMSGSASRKWSNRLMWFRVAAQFVAFVIAMAVLWFGL